MAEQFIESRDAGPATQVAVHDILRLDGNAELIVGLFDPAMQLDDPGIIRPKRPRNNGDVLVAELEEVLDGQPRSASEIRHEAEHSFVGGIHAQTYRRKAPSQQLLEEARIRFAAKEEFRGDARADRVREALGLRKVIGALLVKRECKGMGRVGNGGHRRVNHSRDKRLVQTRVAAGGD